MEQANMRPDEATAAYAWVRRQYARVREAVEEAAVKAGRPPGEIRLMAVTKTVDEALIREAIAAGASLLGENRVQELVRKRPLLPLESCEMHLIGHLQSNKAAKAVECADMIEAVDSLRLARELSRCCEKQGKEMRVLLEVNIGSDAAKFGFAPAQTAQAAEEIAALPGIKVCGLMTVPPISDDQRQTAKFFSRMHQLFIDMRGKNVDNLSMDILSMGMSGDFPLAIAEGSTLVRIGSAIFGRREYR
ncbi:MAG: YggS family pyridoxal phosphate-dependent enzyme [Oscillospiraceae bacterium]|jgi:pyridoxal phosphate enzyme (YggS family)|nr:YggS family pyridoxal phosphate-dependent enzyme [Oscillospiraceae bacterium]